MPTLRSSSLPIPGIAKAVAHLLEDRSTHFCPCGSFDVGVASEIVGFSVEEIWIALGQLQQAGFLSIHDVAEGWCRICVCEDLGL